MNRPDPDCFYITVVSGLVLIGVVALVHISLGDLTWTVTRNNIC